MYIYVGLTPVDPDSVSISGAANARAAHGTIRARVPCLGRRRIGNRHLGAQPGVAWAPLWRDARCHVDGVVG